MPGDSKTNAEEKRMIDENSECDPVVTVVMDGA